MQFECFEPTDLILIHSNKLNYTTMDKTHVARLTAEGTKCSFKVNLLSEPSHLPFIHTATAETKRCTSGIKTIKYTEIKDKKINV